MSTLSIGTGRAHLWYARTDDLGTADDDPAYDDAPVARHRALLTDAERARCDRFVFARHRREQFVTRVLARTVLARYTGVEPSALKFCTGSHGKPFLPAFEALKFNLSNCVTLAACVVSDAHEIGVDVEPFQSATAVLEVATTVFTMSERDELASLPPETRRRRAVALWTLKEAYMKARGLGLALPPAAFAMREQTLAVDPPIPGENDPSRWRFELTEIEDHTLAVCANSGAARPLELSIRHVSLP